MPPRRLALATILSSTVLAPPLSAFEEDIHLHATYLLALAVGLPESRALAIASANQACDSSEAGPLSNAREALRGTATAISVLTVVWPIAFAMGGDYDGFLDYVGKLSDFVAPAPSRHVHFPSRPGFDRVVPCAGEVDHAVSRLLEFAHETGDDLVLGIALHALQDSHSHAGLYPNSHFGDDDRTDDLSTPESRNKARFALWRTWIALTRYAERRGGPILLAEPWPEVRARLESWLKEIPRTGCTDGESRAGALHLAFSSARARFAHLPTPPGFPDAVERVCRLVEAWD